MTRSSGNSGCLHNHIHGVETQNPPIWVLVSVSRPHAMAHSHNPRSQTITPQHDHSTWLGPKFLFYMLSSIAGCTKYWWISTRVQRYDKFIIKKCKHSDRNVFTKWHGAHFVLPCSPSVTSNTLRSHLKMMLKKKSPCLSSYECMVLHCKSIYRTRENALKLIKCINHSTSWHPRICHTHTYTQTHIKIIHGTVKQQTQFTHVSQRCVIIGIKKVNLHMYKSPISLAHV